MYVNMYVCICACVYIYIHICMNDLYVYIYTYIYIIRYICRESLERAGRERERDTHKRTG